MKAEWKTKPLGDLCDFSRGLTYAKKDEVEQSRNIVLRAMNIDIETNLLNFTELKYISDKVTIPESKKIRKNSLLICTASGSKSHLGKVALVEGDYDYAFGGFMGMITPKSEVLPRYFFYRMISEDYRRFIDELADGTNINNLKFDDLRQFPIPVPPLAEQRRIVKLLDEAFAAIDIAKANTEKNLKNAREVFESHLNSVFTQRGEGWRDTTIGGCIRFIDYRGKTPLKTESGIRLITAKNVKMGFLQETPMEFIASNDYSTWMTRGIPKKGDVLFTTEAPLANVAQLDTDDRVAFAQRIIIMQPDDAQLNNTFLKYLLLSSPVQRRIRTQGTGATVQGIKASLLKSIAISFPDKISEQKQFVTRFDALAKETDSLKDLYKKKLDALEELRKSLLHQAFTGNL